MNRHSLIPCFCSLVALSHAATPDILRFTNGDQLHGSFLGLKDGPQALWQRDDLTGPIEFKTTQLRHIILHGAQPLKPLGSISHAGLVNGDRLPGTITAISSDTITLNTSYAGLLHLPRKQVAMLAPNPLGGRLYYHGPFIENEWVMKHAAFPDGMPNEAAPDEPAKEAGTPNPDADDEDFTPKTTRPLPGRWQFSGSAWYWKNKRTGTALIRESGMSDRAVLRFDLAWKNRLNLAVGFHSDFAAPKPKEGDAKKPAKGREFNRNDSTDLPRLFGNSYVIQLYANYVMLYRTSLNADGKTSLDQVTLNHNNNNLRLSETGNASVEIRSNRLSGTIALFINGEFIAQWTENEEPLRKADHFAGKGPGFGFVVQAEDSPVRISEIVASEWNGMPDSARSMQVDDQDVVLMTNGTDRYAGRINSLNPENQVLFEGKHGQFSFPLDEIAEIRFAREHLAPPTEPAAENVCVRFAPIGSISGLPLPGSSSSLDILHPNAGKLHLSLDAAIMLDFHASKQIIDDWNAEF